MLANQVQEHSKRIIHYDQVGVIPNMHEWFNLMQAISMIPHMNRMKN